MKHELKMQKLMIAQTHCLLAMSNAMLSVSNYGSDDAKIFHKHQNTLATEILLEVTESDDEFSDNCNTTEGVKENE